MVLLPVPTDKVKAIASEIKASGDLKIKGAKAATSRGVFDFRMDFVGSETGTMDGEDGFRLIREDDKMMKCGVLLDWCATVRHRVPHFEIRIGYMQKSLDLGGMMANLASICRSFGDWPHPCL